MKGRADRASGLFWLIFSVFVSYQSYELGMGTLHQPGPGFLFFWIGIVTAILALIVVLMSLKKPSPEAIQERLFGKGHVTKIVLVLLSLFLYALLIERLGFLIVTLLFFIFLLGVIEKKKWLSTVSISLIVTAVSYLVFETGLQSQLPKGLLDFLRF
ncbi:MAG TPA: tripartite tricarboxylate transporter TctB family protein [Thermodesulfobacteriota bacterium]|nr:tripartite tricarboxylate transporter TctB family protein [Thermodesulfobacteriota bacterium]